MEVILKETIPSLGKAGDIVKVANGYARNFLVPKGKAIVSSKKNLEQLERQRALILARAAKEKEEFEALAGQLVGLDITIPVKVGEEDRLYGSVTSMDIGDAIGQHGYTVDRRKIRLDEPIKSLGEYEVPVRLSPDVTASLTVKVVPEEA
ncbi:MAG TPA: 50S ribosomal protein L9 [Thermodesulfobacteriaceae bacterium]|nr:50S ribosomal protein L9 [Thermodesulfobacteriaceae bacterium]